MRQMVVFRTVVLLAIISSPYNYYVVVHTITSHIDSLTEAVSAILELAFDGSEDATVCGAR